LKQKKNSVFGRWLLQVGRPTETCETSGPWNVGGTALAVGGPAGEEPGVGGEGDR